jgi:hypothetical protein
MQVEVIPFTLLGGRPGRLPALSAAVGDGHPHHAALTALRVAGLRPSLVHSTSWRYDDGALVLTYAAVVPARGRVVPLAHPVGPTALARGSALAAPPEIAEEQVAHHALVHLAWLAGHDGVVREALSEEWLAALGEQARVPAAV